MNFRGRQGDGFHGIEPSSIIGFYSPQVCFFWRRVVFIGCGASVDVRAVREYLGQYLGFLCVFVSLQDLDQGVCN